MSSSSSSPPPQGQGQGQGRYAVAAAAASRSTTTKRRRGPASEEAIMGLRHIAAASDCSFSSGKECAICLQDFDFGAAASNKDKEEDMMIRALPCSHAFHHHCISRWLRCNAVCPLCRHPLQTQEEEAEERPSTRRRSWAIVFHAPYVHPRDVIDAEDDQAQPPPPPPPVVQLNRRHGATGLQHQQLVEEDYDDDEEQRRLGRDLADRWINEMTRSILREERESRMWRTLF